MANLLKGAMSFLGGSELSGGGASGEQRLLGQRLEVKKHPFVVKRQIAQGGFATVYACQSPADGSWCAAKSQLANEDTAIRAIQEENALLKRLDHPHIIRFLDALVLKTPSSTKQFVMMTELCSGGSAIDLLTAGAPLTIPQVANIVHGATSATVYLHEKGITHRDMKVENLLFSARGVVKLCDFGSCTTEEYAPDDDWTPTRRTKLEEDFQRATTPMYRAPEILDTYLGYPVTRSQDVWALGCVLFYLAYRTHPFEDSAKLRIIYAKYCLPEGPEGQYGGFHPLIQSTLRPDPRERPSAAELLQRLQVLAVAMEVRLDTPVPGIDTTSLTGGEPVGELRVEKRGEGGGGGERRREEREDGRGAGGQQMQQQQAAGQPAANAFSQLRGQGMSMFRNLKEKSAAVMQTVQNTYGSKGPELVWLTSRIVIAPQMEGIPEPLAAQAEESLRNSLGAMRRPFKIINLGQRRLRCEYPEAVADIVFPAEGTGGPAPSMDALLSVMHAAGIYLRQQPAEAFVVVLGSEVHACLAALALLIYHRLAPKPWCAIELLQERRSSTATPLLLPPSSHRLLDALQKSVQPGFGETINPARIQLETLVVEQLPVFNNNRTGCRPLVMVYVGGTSLWPPQPYETLRPYEGAERRRAQFGLHKTMASGCVNVCVFHARMSSLSGRMTQIPMISFGLHTALLPPGETTIELRKGDLDYSLQDEQFVPEEIRVTLHYSSGAPSAAARSAVPGAPRGFLDYPVDIVAPRHLVANGTELEEIKEKFGGGGERSARPPRQPAAAAEQAPQQQQPSGDFFGSLSWGGEAQAEAPPPPPPHRAAAPAAAAAQPPSRMDSMRLDTNLETPILGGSSSPASRSTTDVMGVMGEEMDLLGMGSGAPSKPAPAAPAAARQDNLLFDPFESAPAPSQPKAPQTLDDLFGAAPSSSTNSMNTVNDDLDLFGLGGGGTGGGQRGGGGEKRNGDLLLGDLLGGGGSSMHRNASAPSFPAATAAAAAKKADPFDPFADFLAANPAPAAAASSSAFGGSAGSTRSSTPSMQQQQAARPNYSRSAFDAINPTGMPTKPKSSANCFDDLLQSSGFTSTSSTGGGMGKTMGDMRRAEEIRDLSPEQIKIRDWTAGKERNIRALLASLSEVLWADAPRWEQPSMGSLLTANEVKKYFRKAAIVVHPDKQTGLPHAELAKAIMIELNDAWNAFEEAGSPSLG